jgi:hypothetical protein
MRGSLSQPVYLKGISATAAVDTALRWRFESLLEHSGEIAGIRGAVMNLTGADPSACLISAYVKSSPRRICNSIALSFIGIATLDPCQMLEVGARSPVLTTCLNLVSCRLIRT